MKLARLRRLRWITRPMPRPQLLAGTVATSEPQPFPAVVASAFVRLRLAQRVRVLRRLLLPVGPMALAVIGGGVFAKFAAQARLPRMPLSLEDVARVTSSQIYDLVRYVEQSNPLVVQQVLLVLARNQTTMAALGASVAAIMMQHVANSKVMPPQNRA
jgi:hypothetical protein